MLFPVYRAALWDGTTDYKIEETDHEREQRLENWEKYLAGTGQDNKPQAKADEVEIVEDIGNA